MGMYCAYLTTTRHTRFLAACTLPSCGEAFIFTPTEAAHWSFSHLDGLDDKKQKLSQLEEEEYGFAV